MPRLGDGRVEPAPLVEEAHQVAHGRPGGDNIQQRGRARAGQQRLRRELCGGEVALQSFVARVLLILIFSLLLRLLPAASVRWEQPQTWVLPTLALGLGPLAIFARYTRAGMLDELASDYVRTARAKGLSERAILYGHVLKAALLPVVTVAGPILAAVGTGSFLVETIFSVPGMGRFFVTSIFSKDYPVIMALVVIYGSFLALANLGVDLCYGLIDPRTRVVGMKG